jgi:putative transposase
MSRSATVRSVRSACRIIKRLMNFEPQGWEDYRTSGRDALRHILEERMQGQLRQRLAFEAAEGVRDRRNGVYRRHLLTGMGDIELSVPRARNFSALSVVQAYARRGPDVDRAVLACFVLGLSVRKVAEALLPILGERISPATVSRVSRTLDEAVAAFHRRPLVNRYRVLQFDGVVLSRKTGVGAQKRPVLVVLGILANGRKEVIDFLLAPAESQVAWEGLLNDLLRRGLTAEGVEVITIDGGPGLIAALSVVYPRIPVQRCWAHKVRNVLDKVRVKDAPAMKKELRKIYGATDRGKACDEALRFGARWERIYPAAVRCLMKDLEELLTFFVFKDPEWRKKARTTNAIERRFREVRRRTRPMGVFSDRTSIERILFAVFSYENQNQGTACPFPLLTQNS